MNIFLLCLVMAAPLFGANRGDDDFDWSYRRPGYGYGGYGYGGYEDRTRAKKLEVSTKLISAKIRTVNVMIADLIGQLTPLSIENFAAIYFQKNLGADFNTAYAEALLDAFKKNVNEGRDEVAQIATLKGYLQEEARSLEHKLEDLAQTSAPDYGLVGETLINGLAGRNNYSRVFSSYRPTSILQGAAASVVDRTANVLGDKFEEFLRTGGGDVVEAVVGRPLRGAKNWLEEQWNWLFHGGRDPYTVEQLTAWRDEVQNVILLKLEEYSAKAQRSPEQFPGGTRGRVQPKFDPMALAHGMADDVEEAVADQSWLEISRGLCEDIDRLTVDLEWPKLYYAPGDARDEERMKHDGRKFILDSVRRIQAALQFIKVHVLKPALSLRDLSAGDLKYLLPRVAAELVQRFDLLTSRVRRYHHLPDRAPVGPANAPQARGRGQGKLLDDIV